MARRIHVKPDVEICLFLVGSSFAMLTPEGVILPNLLHYYFDTPFAFIFLKIREMEFNHPIPSPCQEAVKRSTMQL